MAKPEPLNASFALFPELPIELRLRIWSEAVTNSNPRIVEISSIQKSQQSISPTLAPSILHACTEFRNEALKHGHYEKLNVKHPVTLKVTFTGTYVNWAKDTVYLSYLPGSDYGDWSEVLESQMRTEHSELMSKCQRLALSLDCFFKHCGSPTLRKMSDYANLEELTIVIGKREDRRIKEQLTFVPRARFTKLDYYLNPFELSHLSPLERSVVSKCAELFREAEQRFRIFPLMDAIHGKDRPLTVSGKLEKMTKELYIARKEIQDLKASNAELQATNLGLERTLHSGCKPGSRIEG